MITDSATYPTIYIAATNSAPLTIQNVHGKSRHVHLSDLPLARSAHVELMALALYDGVKNRSSLDEIRCEVILSVQAPPQATAGHAQPVAAQPGAIPPQAPAQPPPEKTGLRLALSQTPGQLMFALTLAVILITAAGATAATAMLAKSDVINATQHGSGKLAVTSSELYQALSEANAAASSAFLVAGSEPSNIRETYDVAIRDAAAALASAATQVSTNEDANLVAKINVALPTYTSLVETARTYHRLGQPVSTAHLRLASTMMNSDILPLAEQLRQRATDQLARDQDEARSIPWIAFGSAIVALVFLIIVAIWLNKKSNRVFNLGLMGATVAMIALSGWLVLSSLATATHLDRAQSTGSDPFNQITAAQFAAQEARAAESLLYVARGEDVNARNSFAENMDILAGDDAMLEQLAQHFQGSLHTELNDAHEAAQQWRERHDQVLLLMADGRYSEAIETAMGDGDQTVTGAFDEVNDALSAASHDAISRFNRGMNDAQRALSGTALGLGILAALAVGSAAVGLQQRIREYHA